jgi:hypothetical protein
VNEDGDEISLAFLDPARTNSASYLILIVFVSFLQYRSMREQQLRDQQFLQLQRAQFSANINDMFDRQNSQHMRVVAGLAASPGTTMASLTQPGAGSQLSAVGLQASQLGSGGQGFPGTPTHREGSFLPPTSQQHSRFPSTNVAPYHLPNAGGSPFAHHYPPFLFNAGGFLYATGQIASGSPHLPDPQRGPNTLHDDLALQNNRETNSLDPRQRPANSHGFHQDQAGPSQQQQRDAPALY